MSARRIASTIGRTRLFETLVDVLDRIRTPNPSSVSVLTYHRVDEPGRRDDLYPGLISATPSTFSAQITGLLAARFSFVSLSDVLAVHRGRSTLPPRALLLTFDDAYADFATHAWPVIRALSIPVVLFVPTAFPGRPDTGYWWDRLYHALVNGFAPLDAPDPAGQWSRQARLDRFQRLLGELKARPHPEALATVDRLTIGLRPPAVRRSILDWVELRQLSKEGVTFAPHSRTHPLLTRIPPDALAEELIGSREDLRREVAAAPPVLAYPSGAHSSEVVRATAEAGYELAFTTVRGVNDLRSCDAYRLRRINVGFRSSTPLIRAQIHRWAAA